MFFTCVHSHRRCFELSHVTPRALISFCHSILFHSNMCEEIIVNQSFGLLQLLPNLVMFSSSKLCMPYLFLTTRTSIFFSAFFRSTCSSLTVMVIKFFSGSWNNQHVFQIFIIWVLEKVDMIVFIVLINFSSVSYSYAWMSSPSIVIAFFINGFILNTMKTLFFLVKFQIHLKGMLCVVFGELSWVINKPKQ